MVENVPIVDRRILLRYVFLYQCSFALEPEIIYHSPVHWTRTLTYIGYLTTGKCTYCRAYQNNEHLYVHYRKPNRIRKKNCYYCMGEA